MNPISIESNARLNAVKTIPSAAKLVLGFLEKIELGRLHLTLPNGEQRIYGSGEAQADLWVRDWSVFKRCLSGGDIAFGEAYMQGQIETRDLSALLTLFVSNRAALEKAIYGNPLGVLLDKVLHWLRRNTKTQARKNIAAHYDLGNDFYKLWLDKSWTYSAALFADHSLGAEHDYKLLPEAQQRKYDRTLIEIAAPQGGKLLEIGCGWGGFAQTAAQQGYSVKGLTLSTEQRAFALERLSKQGLTDKVDLALQDYRDESGQYDGIVSIEMFEAVGEQYWDSYFECVARNLKRGAKACIQSITIDESLFERYRRSTDFIQRYIFPGGMLPSKERFVAAAAKQGLVCSEQLAFGNDYARTLAAWHHAFNEKLHAVLATGKSDAFCRMWAFYLAYCEAGFKQGSIDVVQFTLAKE